MGFRPEPPKIRLEDDEDTNAWIVVFSDLMTLLLVFFILLFSLSSLNEAKFKKALTSIQISLGESAHAVKLLDIIKTKPETAKMVRMEDISGLRPQELDVLKRMRQFIEERGLEKNIKVSLENGRVVMRIRGTVLFKSGDAMLDADGKPIMNEIYKIIQEFDDFKVNIKGHTDDKAIATRRFPSNWELSAFRATTVLRYLVDKGIPADRLTATGYAAQLPMVPNDTEENRQKNRRVEFVLEKENR